MSMQEPERAPEYRKDPTQEQRLEQINAALAPLEARLILQFGKPQLPVVFVVGAPRSGTTLLAQVLARSRAVAYVNNFVARFWMAPYIGALVDSALKIGDSAPGQSYNSRLGVSEGWDGPHEFGYFWSRWFNSGETHKLSKEQLACVDTVSLRCELAALEHVYGRPLFFKNLICGLQAEYMAKVFDKSVFLLIERNPVYNMQSLLESRKALYGDSSIWWSIRPKEYPQLISGSKYEQVAGQIYYILEDVKQACSKLPRQRFLEVTYEELCANPRGVLASVIHAVNNVGAAISHPDPSVLPEKFDLLDRWRLSDAEFTEVVAAARRYFGESVLPTLC